MIDAEIMNPILSFKDSIDNSIGAKVLHNIAYRILSLLLLCLPVNNFETIVMKFSHGFQKKRYKWSVRNRTSSNS